MSARHLPHLFVRETYIQGLIEHEHGSKSPDWLRLRKLKKLRLALKDRIQRLISGTARNGRERLSPRATSTEARRCPS